MSEQTGDLQPPTVCTPPETTMGSPAMKLFTNGKKVIPHILFPNPLLISLLLYYFILLFPYLYYYLYYY